MDAAVACTLASCDISLCRWPGVCHNVSLVMDARVQQNPYYFQKTNWCISIHDAPKSQAFDWQQIQGPDTVHPDRLGRSSEGSVLLYTETVWFLCPVPA